jgi:hypothetical protein
MTRYGQLSARSLGRRIDEVLMQVLEEFTDLAEGVVGPQLLGVDAKARNVR